MVLATTTDLARDRWKSETFGAPVVPNGELITPVFASYAAMTGQLLMPCVGYYQCPSLDSPKKIRHQIWQWIQLHAAH